MAASSLKKPFVLGGDTNEVAGEQAAFRGSATTSTLRAGVPGSCAIITRGRFFNIRGPPRPSFVWL